MINYEVKGGVARILATENLIVEHRKCDTAQFNVQTRVLTLPMWEKASESVFDLLVAHEVGHALYTPNIDWIIDRKIPPQFVNVTEDARVEKLMKRRYGGLPKTFFAGYRDMHEDDFFEICNEDLNEMNLADRANLYFKIGNFIDIQFNSEEQDIVDMIGNAETFDDSLNAAEALYRYCKENVETYENVNDQVDLSESGGEGGMVDVLPSDESLESKKSEQIESQENNSASMTDDQPIENGNPDEESDIDAGASDQKNTSVENKEPEVRTDDLLNRNLKQLINPSSKSNVYLEFPNIKAGDYVASNKEIHDILSTEFSLQESSFPGSDSIFTLADNKYKTYTAESKNEVNYLVKEFECKKAADSYSRALTSRTGVLDCSKLHTYKYSEDIFKKVMTVPDGKNHGLIFILDWSGSMSKVMLQTLKQLYSLLSFCKKCNIPFDVYSFTNSWIYRDPLINIYSPSENSMKIASDFTLMNLFSSSVSSRELDRQMKNIWRVVYSFTNYTPYCAPGRFSLSGTPLCETMICLKKIIPNFQTNNNVQKVNCIVLTDGEGNPLTYDTYINKTWIDPETGIAGGYWGCRNVYYTNERVYLRNRSTGKVYKFSKYSAYCHQDTIIRSLQDEFPNVNFIGFRILENGHDAGRFLDQYMPFDEKEKVMTIWKKDRSFAITQTPYNKYFGIAHNSLENQTDFLSQLSDGASKTEIRTAMKKTLISKKLNKKLLNEFVALIA